MKEYPEHEKLEAIAPLSQAAGAFVDWLRDTKRVVLATPHEHTDSCYEERRWPTCGYPEGGLMPLGSPLTELLAEHFQIDLNRIDDEKRAMLERLRQGDVR